MSEVEREIILKLAHDFRTYCPPMERDIAFWGACKACGDEGSVPMFGVTIVDNVKYCSHCYEKIATALYRMAEEEPR